MRTMKFNQRVALQSNYLAIRIYTELKKLTSADDLHFTHGEIESNDKPPFYTTKSPSK